MTAVVPTLVQAIDARTGQHSGTTERALRKVYVEITTTATSNTTDLNSYIDGGVSAIVGVTMNSVDGATSATSPTWSTTTVTWANHAGSGGVVCEFLVY